MSLMMGTRQRNDLFNGVLSIVMSCVHPGQFADYDCHPELLEPSKKYAHICGKVSVGIVVISRITDS